MLDPVDCHKFGVSFLMGSMQIDSALENQVQAQNVEIDCWPFDRGSFAFKVNAKAHRQSFGCNFIHSFVSFYSCMDSTLEPYRSSFHLNCGFDHEHIADSSFCELQMHPPVGIPARPRPFKGGQFPEPSHCKDRVRIDTKSAFEIYDSFITGSSSNTIQDIFAANDTKAFDSTQIKAD